jgi:hypothetical protein
MAGRLSAPLLRGARCVANIVPASTRVRGRCRTPKDTTRSCFDPGLTEVRSRREGSDRPGAFLPIRGYAVAHRGMDRRGQRRRMTSGPTGSAVPARTQCIDRGCPLFQFSRVWRSDILAAVSIAIRFAGRPSPPRPSFQWRTQPGSAVGLKWHLYWSSLYGRLTVRASGRKAASV